jgi:hypothetical protein
MNPNLTPEDFDWLRKMQAATDAKQDPPPIPMESRLSFARSAS